MLTVLVIELHNFPIGIYSYHVLWEWRLKHKVDIATRKFSYLWKVPNITLLWRNSAIQGKSHAGH